MRVKLEAVMSFHGDLALPQTTAKGCCLTIGSEASTPASDKLNPTKLWAKPNLSSLQVDNLSHVNTATKSWRALSPKELTADFMVSCLFVFVLRVSCVRSLAKASNSIYNSRLSWTSDPSASASPVLRLQVCTTMSGSVRCWGIKPRDWRMMEGRHSPAKLTQHCQLQRPVTSPPHCGISS